MGCLTGHKMRALAFIMALACACQTGIARGARSATSTASRKTNLAALPPVTLHEISASSMLRKTKLAPHTVTGLIPRDAVVQLGSAPFVGVFQFLPYKRERVRHFRAEPRSFLVGNKAWYVRKHSTGLVSVFVAMQLSKTQIGSSELPRVLIDIKCRQCYTKTAVLRFTRYSALAFGKNLFAYHLAHPRVQNAPRVGALALSARIVPGEPRYREFQFTAAQLCSPPHGVAFLFYSHPSSSTPTVQWLSSLVDASGDNPLLRPYDAETDEKPDSFGGRLAFFNPREGGKDMCANSPSAMVSLKISCGKRCGVAKYGRLISLAEPLLPHGVSSTASAHIEGNYMETLNTCKVVFVNGTAGFDPVAAIHDNAVVRTWYQYSDACGDSGHSLAHLYERWPRQIRAHWLEGELVNRMVTFEHSVSLDRCVCNGLRGGVYRKLDTGSAGENEAPVESTEADLMHPVDETSDFSSFEQRVAAVRRSPSDHAWTLAINTFSALRCATRNVTATFTLSSDYPVTGVEFLASSSARLRGPFLYGDAQAVEVTIKPLTAAASVQTCVNSSMLETLSLLLTCRSCTLLKAVVRFTPAPAFMDIPQEEKKLIPSSLPAEGGLSRLRFSAPVHQHVLARGGGTKFTASLSLYPRGDGRIIHCHVRPRTLLTDDRVWYMESNTFSYRTVYVAMQLPDSWKAGSESPSIVIDIECDNCGTDDVLLSYEPERPAETFKQANVFSSFNPEGRSWSTVTAHAGIEELSVAEPKKISKWNVTLSKLDLCVSPFGAVVQLGMTAALPANQTFQWVLPVHDRILKASEATVGAPLSGLERRVVVIKPNTEEYDVCSQESSRHLSLLITCQGKCVNRNTAYVWKNEYPEIPQGASSEPVANLVTTSRRKKGSFTCNLAVEDEKLRTVTALGNRAVFRLWHTNSSSCTEPVGSQIQSLEGNLLGYIASGGLRFITSQCVCDGLQGRVYRLLDWELDNVETQPDTNSGDGGDALVRHAPTPRKLSDASENASRIDDSTDDDDSNYSDDDSNFSDEPTQEPPSPSGSGAIRYKCGNP